MANWWDVETKKKYKKRAKCIIDQYSNYTINVDGEILKLNGFNTQGENIADNGGVKIALNAYQALLDREGPEPVLPGLPYNQRQLFWLSSASTWCSVHRPESLKYQACAKMSFLLTFIYCVFSLFQVLTDPHTPDMYQVNGVFANQKEFARDWNCPLGSTMNPVKKCEVW